ncbi:VCBS repeat-containing protein [Fulvivirgaceae bacterium BMA10]|uniref:VCBS repeat-containing protein n=1 Tax=Splendidivirga corallicola TaxID=3051826 RepID=A0ABT8KP39_9BACT|nr:VCBS repeat-containing protein [Fulvivirgaceae bacterium BMA10]
MKFAIWQYLFVLIVVFGCSNDRPDSDVVDEENVPSRFVLLPPEQTNVDFQNILTEGLNTNVLMYEYFYNGGGVATGDLNGDGLIDIYFTSNMGDNKLYINDGNMQFRDVTAISGTSGRPGPWKTGVTVVDINGDKQLDLYVCYSGALPDAKRTNQLFINQGTNSIGIPIFSEQAEKYGLASQAYSNQIYFFDYDRDGDLDALLLNHNPKSLPLLNEASTRKFLDIDDPLKGVRLYRQDNGYFKDLTKESGISGSQLSYGLGIGITDFDNDGWSDFYISNDYAIPDYLYMNNHDGTFTNTLHESLGHNSQFSMGNDIADVNNDGLQDIVTLDMLPEDNRRQKLLLSPNNYSKFDLNVRSGFHYQFMRNMLQLNNGNGTFSEIGQLAGISNTDWSWAALIADYDNDGWKDLFVTNGYHRDYTNLDFINYMDNYVATKGRLVREEVLDILAQMPSSHIVNYIFSNEEGYTFSNRTKSWGMDHPSNSNGASYADLDNDGDLDLVVNNINKPAFIYENESNKYGENNFLQVVLNGVGLNTQGLGTRVTVWYKGLTQSVEQYHARGYLSAVSPTLHFGLGDIPEIDSLLVVWTSGKKQLLKNIKVNQKLTLHEQNAQADNNPKREAKTLFDEIPSPIKFQNPKIDINDFKRQPLLISGMSFSGPCMAKGDVNGDGLEDVFVGGAKDQSAAIFIQQKDGQFIDRPIAAFQADRHSEDADAVFFDANNDGNLDIYVASGGYHTLLPNDTLLQDRLYINDGEGNFLRDYKALPEMLMSKSCITVNDVNKDGYADLFIGGHVIPGRYPEIPDSYLLINDGNGRFRDLISSMAPELQNFGMINDAVWMDINQDEEKELIIVGEWTPVSVFAIENGKLINRTLTYFDKLYSGWWNKIEVADFNNDQKPDLIVGNVGTNTQFKVSDEEPAEMYFKDFDNNGAVDPLFCYYIQGSSYPYLTRDELLGQLVGLRSRFTSYKSYADATITDIFNEEELSNAGYLQANHMETSLFICGENGRFELKALPLEAQYAPVNAITVLDYNNDGNKDMLLCGNNSHTKLRLGRFDANYGMLLKGNGNGGFNYINQSISGLKLQGDVRSIIQLNDIFLFGLNQHPIVSYQLKE